MRPEGAHLLDPVEVVIPNLAVGSYLTRAIAEKTGIAANLSLTFLERFLFGVAESAGRRVTGLKELEAAVLRPLLDGELLANEDMAPVREYLAAGGDDPSAVDLRRFQLARNLAKHFDEYVLTRGEMLETWRRTTLFHGTGYAPTERWERAIWLDLERKGAVAPLPSVYEDLDLAGARLPGRIHLFDVALAAPAYQRILARLAERSDLYVYASNPCREFWEDVSWSADAEAPDNPLLRLWGRPKRESVRILNELSGFDFDARFDAEETARPTLLEALRRDILTRAPERIEPSDAFADDESIAFLACPGLRREVEAVAQEIWALIEARQSGDRPLHFDEIAVILASKDAGAYRAHIGAVFDEFYEIPHVFLDVPLASQSRVVEAIELLFALPHSRFSRQDLLRLVTHPCLMAKVDGADPDEWLEWADDLAIVHGADRDDHRHTYIERDLYNWEQGLLRMLLGTFMTGQRSGDDRVFSIAGQDYLPFEYPADRIESAAALATLVRSLIADARYAESARLTFEEWARFLRALITAYVGPAGEQDERDLFRCLGAVDELAGLDPGGPLLSFRIAAETAKERIGRLTTSVVGGQAGGVIVAPLAVLHSIPRRVTFILGMGEGRFPSSDRRSQLDLRFAPLPGERGAARKIGDVTPRERDQYRFLEVLLGTREAIRISWVSRDAQTGEELMPSPIVLELQQILESGYTRDVEQLVRRQPLRRYRERGDRIAPLNVARESGAIELRESLRAHLGDPMAALSLHSLRRQLPFDVWSRLAERLRLAEPPRGGDRDRTSPLVIRTDALRRFLEDPLQGWAKFVLELSDEEETDPLAREDELFTTSAYHATVALRRVLIEKMRRDAASDLAVSLEDLYRARADRLELAGVLPTGVFGRAERHKHERILLAWQKQVRDALNGRPSPIDPIRFGRAREEDAVESADPIPLEVDLGGGHTVSVEIHGKTQPILRAPAGSIALTMRPPYHGRPARLLELRGFVDQVVLSAAGRAADVPFVAAVAFGEDDLRRTELAPFSRAEATDYLRTLVQDLLSHAHAYLLPFTTVLEIEKVSREGRLGTARLQRILANARHDELGPLVDPQVDAPERSEIDRILERRFAPYFRRRSER